MSQIYKQTSGGGGSGTVTSVGLTVPAFLSVSGSPITTAGTLAVSYSGTALPTANGGTGLTSPGTSGNVLTSNGTVWVSSPPASSSFTWTDQGSNFSAAANNGYFITANATATLPASPSQGNTIKFIVLGGTLTIQANTGQTIRVGTAVSATAGTAQNSEEGSSIALIYRSTGTSWNAEEDIGQWGLSV